MLRFDGIIAGAALPFPIDKPRRGWYTEFVCGYGGIGRRARLRIWYLRCAGSTPVTRTTSEWTALHSKSPAGQPGFFHTAPSFHLGPRAAAYAAVGLETRLRAQSFSPQNFANANFCGGPGRPKGGKYANCASLAAAYFKPPARSLRCGSFSPQIFAAQTSAGNLSARSALASPAMEYRDYQRNHECNCRLHCYSSYRSFVFILSSSSFSCFSD